MGTPAPPFKWRAQPVVLLHPLPRPRNPLTRFFLPALPSAGTVVIGDDSTPPPRLEMMPGCLENAWKCRDCLLCVKGIAGYSIQVGDIVI